MRALLIGLVALAWHCTATAQRKASEPQTAKGIVFHDRDGDGKRDPGEKRLPGIRVSNGREVVETGRDGSYRLPIGTDDIVFVIKPSGWQVRIGPDRLPLHYYLHKPNGSPKSHYPGVAPTGPLPKSIDFGLTKRDEPSKFNVVLFGDPQPRTLREVDYVAHDVVDEVIGIEAAFGITLGDVMFDDLSLFEPLNRVIARIGLPWFNVYGNHDMNVDAASDAMADETFERIYGPTNYSLDWADAHFVILDNVEFIPTAREGQSGYKGLFNERALRFLANDLALVSKDKLVVVCFHIHLDNVANRAAFLRLLKSHPHNMSISAHTHVHRVLTFGRRDGYARDKPHLHINHGTVCGSFWGGVPDERGIPHATMADGGNNGWGLLAIDGNRFAHRYKAAGRPWGYQLSIFAPDTVAQSAAADTEVVVNVFAGSARSTVEMRLGEQGRWVRLRKDMRPDPRYLQMKAVEKAFAAKLGGSVPWSPLPTAQLSHHIWVGRLPRKPPPGTHLIHVRSKDMFGQVHAGRRTIRIQ